MRRTVYRDLADALIQDGHRFIRLLYQRQDGRLIYAFCLNGRPVGALVRYEAASIPRQEARSYLTVAEDECLLDSPLFDVSRFEVQWEDHSEVTRRLLEDIAEVFATRRSPRTLQRHRELFYDSLSRVILALESDLQSLPLTDEFIAFVASPDAGERMRFELMLRTVPDSRLRRLFPGVYRFREAVDGWARLDRAKQAELWLDAFIACQGMGDVKLQRQLARIGVDDRRALRALKEGGSRAIPSILARLEEIIGEEPFAGSTQRKQLETALGLIDAVDAIRLVDETGISLLVRLRDRCRSGSSAPAEQVASRIAALLHRLRPHRFD